MQVCLINKKVIEVTEIGKAEVFFNRKKLTLNEVLYVSELNKNLLLIEAVSSHKITVKFQTENVFFKHNENVIATVK